MSTSFQAGPQLPSRDSVPGGATPPWLGNLRAVFVVIFVSIVLYAIIGTFLSRTHSDVDYDLQQIYKALSYLGGLCVAGLLLIRNLINRAQAATEGGVGTTAGSPRRVRWLILMAFVISEVIALLGLAFVLVGGSARILYMFCAVSLACLILFFPRDPQ
ncbi:MAG: hypothetical protein PHX83_02730 [Acidobacteriia bacterium]|nr:hypothetical protein [Terriglobia bacterium]